MSGNSGCPVVSLGGVIGVMASLVTIEDVMDNTERLVATKAVYTSTVLDVMKQWLHLPANVRKISCRQLHMHLSFLLFCYKKKYSFILLFLCAFSGCTYNRAGDRHALINNNN